MHSGGTYVALHWLNTNHRIDAMCNVQSSKCEKTVQYELKSVGCTFTDNTVEAHSCVDNSEIHL